jgi:diaminopimelate decarboxylase
MGNRKNPRAGAADGGDTSRHGEQGDVRPGPAGTATAGTTAAGTETARMEAARAETADTAGAERAARRDEAVRAAVEQGLLGPGTPIVGLLDVVGIRASAAELRAAFDSMTAPGTPALHAFAVKATPLVPVLRLLREAGLGAEVASPGELALARAAGVAPARTVLDSPAKTAAELREALVLGVAVNADNPQELDRIDTLVRSAPTRSPLGIRVNPQVGGGTIDATSTATARSKFGVALQDEGAREWVIRACEDHPWLTRLHTHTGSQGVPLSLMARGVEETYALAEEINHLLGRRQIDTIDIGGGLPVNFGSDSTTPTYAQYARLLSEAVPGLFDGRYGLVTEFGRSLLAKHGTVVARVEYAKRAGGRLIAVTHAGVQVATRTVYAPSSWPLRIAAYDPSGSPKKGPAVFQDVAGPACFSGDLLAEGVSLPFLEPGDYVAALDTGAYYFAHHYGYNSLPRPAIHGFAPHTTGGKIHFGLVRAPQTPEDIVREAGGDQPGVLLDLWPTGPAVP